MHKTSIPTKLVIAKSLNEFCFEFEKYLKDNQIDELLIVSGLTHVNNFCSELTNRVSKTTKIEITTNLDINKIKKNYSWILGLGGGKVLDQAKYLAACQKANFISVPTLITHDGICSPVAVIDDRSMGAIMPHALFVPLFIIQKSPIIHIKAGIGDLIANLSAIDDWKLAKTKNNEENDDFAIMISKKSASDIILKLKNNYLKPYYSNPIEFLRSEIFLSSLIESLALSGIAMSITCNSRPCSGGEHLISHAIDKIFGHGTKAPHGIQVLIASLYLEKYRTESSLMSLFSSLKEFQAILEYYEFPTEFINIDINEKDLKNIIEMAPLTRPGRYSILNDIYIKNH